MLTKKVCFCGNNARTHNACVIQLLVVPAIILLSHSQEHGEHSLTHISEIITTTGGES